MYELAARLSARAAPPVSIDALAHAARRHPRLLRALPPTIAANVVDAAALLDLTVDAFIRAALKTPALFYQAPLSIQDRVGAVAFSFFDGERIEPDVNALGQNGGAQKRDMRARGVLAGLGEGIDQALPCGIDEARARTRGFLEQDGLRACLV